MNSRPGITLITVLAILLFTAPLALAKEVSMQQSPHPLLAHERLDAYGVAVELAEHAHALSRQLPRSKGQLGDQLSRASESIMLCIAEGSGVAWHSAECRVGASALSSWTTPFRSD